MAHVVVGEQVVVEVVVVVVVVVVVAVVVEVVVVVIVVVVVVVIVVVIVVVVAVVVVASEARKGVRPFTKPRSHAIEHECMTSPRNQYRDPESRRRPTRPSNVSVPRAADFHFCM